MASIEHPKGRRSTWQGQGEWVVRWRNKLDPETGAVRQRKLKRQIESRSEAEELCTHIDAAVTLHGFWWPVEWGRGEVRPADEGVAATAVVARYCKARQTQGVSAATSRRDAQCAAVFCRWLDAEKNPEATAAEILTKAAIERWAKWLRATPNQHGQSKNARTRKRYAGWLLGVWQWALHEPDLRPGVPSPVIALEHLTLERPEPRAPVIAPTWAEMDAVIVCSSGWQQRLYILLRCTGLRVTQGMALRWTDFDIERGILTIRRNLPGSKTQAEKRGRRMPFAPALEPYIKVWRAASTEPWVIPTGRTGADARSARSRDAGRAWRRAIEQYGVREEATKAHHVFRSGLMSGLKKLGADTEAVEHLVGHDLGVRGEAYIDPDAMGLVPAVNLVPDIDRHPSREKVVASSSARAERRSAPTLLGVAI